VKAIDVVTRRATTIFQSPIVAPLAATIDNNVQDHGIIQPIDLSKGVKLLFSQRQLLAEPPEPLAIQNGILQWLWFYVLPVAQYHGILGTSRQNQIACCWIVTTQVASIYPPVLVNGLGPCLRNFIISLHNLGTASNHHTHITMRQSGSIRQGGGLAFGIEKNAFCVNLFNQYTPATKNGIFQ
jgi:hypothetical protein